MPLVAAVPADPIGTAPQWSPYEYHRPHEADVMTSLAVSHWNETHGCVPSLSGTRTSDVTPPHVFLPHREPLHVATFRSESSRAEQAQPVPLPGYLAACSSKRHAPYEPPTPSPASMGLVMQPTSSAGANVGTCRYCGQLQSDLLTHLRQALAEERTLFLAEPRADLPVLQTTSRVTRR
jgi:hypothetical protein